MALLPDLESAEQAYERGWNEAIKAAVTAIDRHDKTDRGWVNNSLWDILTRETARRVERLIKPVA